MKVLPETIGPYRIIQKLGKGGFATVYLAHPKNRAKTQNVALKVLDSRENYARFQREVETIAKLDHPNIIHIYDTGEDQETKTPYFAMEYVPSGTLRDKLATEYRLSRIEAIALIKQIGFALTFPHQQGIIHRDVNPNNILLDTKQNPIRPILTDFGMVKPLAPQDSKLTKTIALIGTFAYYAPEQWKQEAVTPATDVYALAITFFEMISGQRPFKGDIFSLRDKHLNESLPLLSSVAPEVGSFFDNVLLKGTAKTPADRYQNVASFIESLEAANNKAEEAAKMARQKRAIESIEIAQDRWEQSNYPLDEILEIIDTALDDYPRYNKALRLRGKIKLNQQQFIEALEDFRQGYEQEGKIPSSDAGLDYLNALQQATKFHWQNQAYSEAVNNCKTIKQVLNENPNENGTLQFWREAWSELVKAHYDAGVEAITTNDPQDITQTIELLDREIEALEALDAQSEARAFKDKLKMLQIRFYRDTGIEAFAEGYPDDLAAAMSILEREIEALENLEAYDESRDLQDKLRVLQIREHYDAGLEAYRTNESAKIRLTIEILEREIMALEAHDALDESRDLQDKLRMLQVEDHYITGIEAFAEGSPNDVSNAAVILEREIQALQALNAGRECQELYSKLSVLQIKEHYNKGLEAFATSDRDNSAQTVEVLKQEIEALENLESDSELQDLQDKLVVLQVKDHYKAGIVAYADGNPENLAEAISTLEFEIQSLQTLEATHECQGLGKKLRSLQLKRDKDKTYSKIQDMVSREEYSEALILLDKEFIQAGNYEYQDVTRLLWGLVHAKKHNGQLPLGWKLPTPRQNKLEKQHKINKFTIPIFLFIAVILGGIIAPQIEFIPGLTIILFISLAALILYFAYYIWVYYVDM